jgi:hypothetical protein
MSFDKLRKALVTMPPTGLEGFEGLAATLLSAVTSDLFYIARAGDQPADALSAAGNVAMQGKRYDKTPLDETEFEGDFHKACRLCPNLDCYVLAATRSTAQLNLLARDLENRTGVDVILLQFDSPDSELSALCVVFWNRIKDFEKLSELGPNFAIWAEGEAQKPEITATVERLRATLVKSVPLAATVERKLTAYLNGRFGIDALSRRPSRFRIELPTAVVRQAPQQQLTDWWKQRNARVAVLEGEEGMGKSWVASAFCYQLIQYSAALVLWLDSADWSGLSDLESVMNAGLIQAGFGDPQLRERLGRKAMNRWFDKLLIVLDGVNERAARDTAQRLLAQFHAAEIAPFRLLFTTRPISWKSDERSLWQTVTMIQVGQFTEEELKDALAKLPAPIPREELPTGLVEVAKIPRYFRRAIELRDRFKSLANISKEMVLWADLLAKVEAGDPQITSQIGWGSPANLKRALIKLASEARAVQTSAHDNDDNYSLLQKCFGEQFERIRTDLAEQRVLLEPTSENPAPSPEHIILGFALHLGFIAAKHASDNVNDLADRLRAELESVLAHDQLTEALFVALQLSAFPNSNLHTLSSPARSALLLAWSTSQNSLVEAPRLTFWAHEDMNAYLDFIEEVFVEPVSDRWSSLIIAPLLEIWRTPSLDKSPLDLRLRRWLKLIWKSHDFTAGSETTVDGHVLPTARTQSQLELSLVALAVLSERPCDLFLPDLAIAWATHGQSTQRHIWPDQPSGEGVNTRDIGCKDMSLNLGALLRWRYRETVKPKIEALRVLQIRDPLMVKGFDRMLDTFDEFGWVRCSIPEERLRNKTPFFPIEDGQNLSRFMDCPELAARDDLPDLCANDQKVIAEKVERVFGSRDLHGRYERTREDLELQFHLSWFAKYRSERLVRLASSYRLACFDGRQIGPALSFANLLPFASSLVDLGELLIKAKACAERDYSGSPSRLFWSLLQLHVLAFTCLGEIELKDWLIFTSERKGLRREMHCYPIPILCPFLLPDAIANYAREQAKRCCDEPADASAISESEFDFWACLGGLGGGPDLAINQWVNRQIKLTRPTGMRQYYYLLMWWRTAPQNTLEEQVSNGSIVEFLADHGWLALRTVQRQFQDWSKLPGDVNSIAKILPIDELGTVLLNADHCTDLANWGQMIFKRALELVEKPPFERSFWGTTIHTVGDSGEIIGSSFDRAARPVNDASERLRPEMRDPFANLRNRTPLDEVDRRMNEELRIWRQDQDQLDTAEHRAFNRFEATRALRAWRDQHSEEFRNLASELLAQVCSQPSRAFHIGVFALCVLDALVPLNPDLSIKTHRIIRDGSLNISLINAYGASTFTAAFWRAAADGNKRCQEECALFIRSSITDEELMYHAITAQAEGSGAFLSCLCNQLLSAPLAKDRCLAVSLLAWRPDLETIGQLESLTTNDPSGWVRTHAKWALECARHEASVRRFYERILNEKDLIMVQTQLQVMLPALTPSARWWHLDLESNGKRLHSAPPDVQTALAFFWYEARSECGKTPKLFGRTLGEYLRGERIHDLRTPAPRLLDVQTNDH